MLLMVVVVLVAVAVGKSAVLVAMWVVAAAGGFSRWPVRGSWKPGMFVSCICIAWYPGVDFLLQIGVILDCGLQWVELALMLRERGLSDRYCSCKLAFELAYMNCVLVGRRQDNYD